MSHSAAYLALAHMAEAAANGEAGGLAATASSNAEHPGSQSELGDADNAPRAVESDPTRRYTRVSAGSTAAASKADLSNGWAAAVPAGQP